jgi:hypothetical protein
VKIVRSPKRTVTVRVKFMIQGLTRHVDEDAEAVLANEHLALRRPYVPLEHPLEQHIIRRGWNRICVVASARRVPLFGFKDPHVVERGTAGPSAVSTGRVCANIAHRLWRLPVRSLA